MKKVFLAFIFLLAFGVSSAYASEKPEMQKSNIENQLDVTPELSEEVLEVLTEEDFAAAYEILTETTSIEDFEKQEKELDQLIIPILIDIAKTKENSIKPYSILPDAYNRLNDTERKLAKKHPTQAAIVYNCSAAATGLAGKLYKNGNADNHNGNAFKHAFWNAAMTRDMNATKAKTWGDAHEVGAKGVSKDMDLKNNKIGRDTYVALADASFLKPSYTKIQKELMKKIDQGKLYRVVNGKLVKTNSSGKK